MINNESGRPFFSIIIPTFNAAKVISDCIKSVINQSYENFEVLVMDGDSNDGTLEVIRSFSDRRIRLFSSKDKGIYDAMNKGLQYVQGEWLYFLGSDDRLFNKNVLLEISRATAETIDVLYGNVLNDFGENEGSAMLLERILYKNLCHQVIFYRRRVFDMLGAYDTRFKAYADWDFNLRWYFSGKITGKYIDVTVAKFASGGVSMKGDARFKAVRILRYLQYSRNQLPFERKVALVWTELKKGILKRDLNYIFQVMRYLPVILMSSGRSA